MSTPSRPPSPARRLLVVEDDEAVRDSLRLVLELQGYAVAEAGSGEDLLRMPDLERCFCLLIDIDLPGISGVEALRMLRARGPAPPAILMTGWPGLASSIAAPMLGATFVFPKPIDIDALFAALDTLARSRAGQAATP